MSRERLERFGDRVRLHHGTFADLTDHLEKEGLDTVNGILADLGPFQHATGRWGSRLRVLHGGSAGYEIRSHFG